MKPLAAPNIDLGADPGPQARTRVRSTARVRPTAAHAGRDGSRAICQVASESAPDVWYTVYEQRADTLFCTCPDFLYRRSQRGEECKHLRELRVQGLLQTTAPAARAVSDLSLPRLLILDLPEVSDATRGDHRHDHARRPRHGVRQGGRGTAL